MFSSLLLEVLAIVRRPRHTALCVLRHLLLRWKTGKLPVLGRASRSCSACSYLGRAAALCRFLKAQQSGPTGAKSLSQIPDVPLSCWAVLGIFRREGILVAAAPATLGLAPSPYPRRAGWAGGSPCTARGRWLERADPTRRLGEVRAAANSIPRRGQI